ncbi:Pre-mRNA-splicing factor cwc26 [Arachnomyces sp. PD_36]|nr:Pre-mRNA-splicing factor cwc26 [Arachnomyces sp. PD_36]
MSLAEYLAKNYLTADTPSSELSTRPKKKRKKNKTTTTEEPSGLIIADDDDPLSIRTPSASYNRSSGRNDPDEDTPLTVTGPNPGAEFRRTKKSGWKTVAAGGGGEEQEEADRILASAAREAREKADEEGEGGEDAPAMVEGADESDDGGGGPRMESGAKAGLQTAAQTAEMVKAMEKKKRKEAAKNKDKSREDGGGETIYRDASGRVINVAMKRAEARRIADEEAKKEADAKEALKGDVQRREREERREKLEEAKILPFARGVDDEDLNEKMKARERWNDPAAEFLTSTTTSGAGGGGGKVSSKPVYKGAAPPNRYGIRPGYRWDGVDRSNKFESEWFAARNKRERIGNLEYAWQMDE